MYVLGLSSHAHESSCALLKDGRIIALAEEERFNRERHTSKFPKQALEYCLREAGIGFDEIDHVAFFCQPLRHLTGNIRHVLRYFPKSLGLLTAHGGSDLGMLAQVRAQLSIGRTIATELGLKRAPRVEFVEHHLCHAASAFYLSGFESAAILTVDGRGESTTTLLAQGEGSRLTKLGELKVPHSLGHFYSAITDWLGFKPFFDEWKVMGLSAYGSAARTADFEDVLRIGADGLFELNLDYFDFHVRGASSWVSQRFLERFGAKLAPGARPEPRHLEVAFAAQRRVEEAGVALARSLREKTGSPNLCLAGGVALNCLMNRAILDRAGFERVFIQPVANDAGTSLGSALYSYHQLGGRAPAHEPLRHVYLGPQFDAARIQRALDSSGLRYERHAETAQLCETVARALCDGKIVGWFQGRMEAGPRALGNRSLLAAPTDASMRERLNARVKHRESFRPFAPSVKHECASEYFDLAGAADSPFMVLTAKVREAARERLPAVTHVDGTARLQTVEREVNPRYWSLLDAYEKLSGIPVLLNTSFNENEPIVCTPEEAIACYRRTGFDLLVLGDYVIS